MKRKIFTLCLHLAERWVIFLPAFIDLRQLAPQPLFAVAASANANHCHLVGLGQWESWAARRSGWLPHATGCSYVDFPGAGGGGDAFAQRIRAITHLRRKREIRTMRTRKLTLVDFSEFSPLTINAADAISQTARNGTLKGYCGKLTIIYSSNHITLAVNISLTARRFVLVVAQNDCKTRIIHSKGSTVFTLLAYCHCGLYRLADCGLSWLRPGFGALNKQSD